MAMQEMPVMTAAENIPRDILAEAIRAGAVTRAGIIARE